MNQKNNYLNQILENIKKNAPKTLRLLFILFLFLLIINEFKPEYIGEEKIASKNLFIVVILLGILIFVERAWTNVILSKRLLITILRRKKLPSITIGQSLENLKLQLLKNSKSARIVQNIRENIGRTFQLLLILFLITLLLQEFKPEWVAQNISLNYFLIVVIIFGVLAVLLEPKREVEKIETITINLKDYIFIAIAGIVGAFIIFYKIENLGWLAYMISALSGILIILLSILMLEEEEEDLSME